MDHATLTDNNGKKADFRNVIMIMTTNAGAREMSGASMGFTQTAASGKGRGAIERTFAPEFRNRLDAWIAFEPLAFETIEKVVDKFIGELRVQLAEKKVTLEMTEPGRAWLAKNGYDAAYGARPMARRWGRSPSAGCPGIRCQPRAPRSVLDRSHPASPPCRSNRGAVLSNRRPRAHPAALEDRTGRTCHRTSRCPERRRPRR